MYESAGVVSRTTPHPAIAKILNLSGAVMSVWALFLEGPFIPVIVLLLGFPLIACMFFLQTNGSYELGRMRYDPRPTLAIAFGCCSVALIICSLRDFPLLNFIPTLLMASVAGLVLTVVVADVDRKARESGKLKLRDRKLSRRLVFFVVVLIFAASYFFGAIVQANALLDKSVPVTYRAVVIRKSVSSSRNSRHRNLWLAPWGPHQEVKSEWVTPSLYRSVEPGQSVCVDLHPGFGKIPWYVVRECR